MFYLFWHFNKTKNIILLEVLLKPFRKSKLWNYERSEEFIDYYWLGIYNDVEFSYFFYFFDKKKSFREEGVDGYFGVTFF